MRHERLLLVMIVIAAGLLCSDTAAYSSTTVVRKDGTGDFTTVDAAISAAAEGDTILVGPGEYDFCHGYYLYKGLHVISEEGAATTTLRNWGCCTVSCIYFGSWGFDIRNIATSFTIQGFTLHSFYCDEIGQKGFAIMVTDSDGYIADNIIYDVPQVFAFMIEGESDVRLERNLIYDCAGAIRSRSSGRMSIRHNTIADNYWQVYITGTPSLVTIRYNIVANGGRLGIYSDATYMSHIITCNDVWNNDMGDYGGLLPDMTGYDGNISEDPLFCGIAGSGNYYLQGNSPCACGAVSGFCSLCPMGCLPVYCSVATEEKSWGEIKSMFK